MSRDARVTVALMLALVGCADSVVKPLAAENDPRVDNQPGRLQFVASELDNVHDVREATWENPESRATVTHRSFVHHGQVTLSIFDSQGSLLYSTPLEWELENQTQAGEPGLWTVRLQFAGARGRVDVTIHSLAGEGNEEEVPPLPPTPNF